MIIEIRKEEDKHRIKLLAESSSDNQKLEELVKNLDIHTYSYEGATEGGHLGLEFPIHTVVDHDIVEALHGILDY